MAAILQRIKSPLCQFLLSSEKVLFSESSRGTLKALCPERVKMAAKCASSERNMAHTQGAPLLLDLLESTACPVTTDLPVAPTLNFSETSSEGRVQVTLPVDVLALVRWDTNVANITAWLKDRICAQLQTIEEEMWPVSAGNKILQL